MINYTNEELLEQYLSGDESAFDKLYVQVKDYIRDIAIGTAKKFNAYKIDKDTGKISNYTELMLEELQSIGTTEFFYHLQQGNYNPEKAKLTTYLTPFIKSAMYDFMSQNVGAFSISKHTMAKIRRIQRMYYTENKSPEDIAKELDIKLSNVNDYINYNTHSLSVHDLLPEDSEDDPYDYLLIEDLSMSVDRIVYHKICIELLHEMFDELSAKDKFVLQHTYGLFGEKKYTLEEIGLRLTMRPDGVEKARHAAENRLKENYQESKLRLWRIVHRAVMDEALHGPQ